ncbi:MAG: glycosyltransferase [Spirulinaceae cyanobacterium]
MTVSKWGKEIIFGHSKLRWLIFVVILAGCAITIVCLPQTCSITNFFTQLSQGQQNPPFWLEVPNFKQQYSLFLPTIILFGIAQGVMKVSPQPQKWSRVIIVAIILAVTVRYLLWRSLSTLNLDTLLNGIFSFSLLALEAIIIAMVAIQLFFLLHRKVRNKEADRMAVAVADSLYTPLVDIFIPTYSEPTEVLRRTIIGCQILDYPNKTVYLLDDSRRPEMAQLALELGCKYITRPNNIHAKAGNLNYALGKTKGELIAVFDADFIPTQNFLTRTVGFFQKVNIALVQTHQEFYNFEPLGRNLGLGTIIPHDQELFSRHNQPIRDGADIAMCYGSSFLVRRTHLETIGGFVTASLSEDYATSIKLSASGYQVIYLAEKLSSGLAAEDIEGLMTQRLRWARGTLQTFFIDANPLTIPGLNFRQRLANFESLLYWFTNISRAAFLILPILYSFLNIIPVQATINELLYFFLPYYLLNIAAFSWLNNHSRSALTLDFANVVYCLPVAITVIQTLIKPFSKGFKVTPKGIRRDRSHLNWLLATPLILLFLGTLLALGRSFGLWLSPTEARNSLGLIWFWSTYNLFLLGIAIFSLIDIPQPNSYPWFDLQRVVKIEAGGQVFAGVTTTISEIGAKIKLTQNSNFLKDIDSANLTITKENLILQGKVKTIQSKNNISDLQISFTNLSLEQERQLIALLFCRPGQWLFEKAPGELASLFFLIKSLLLPRIFFVNRGNNQGRKVAQN